MSRKLDLYDKKILHYLDMDSRMPATQLSKLVKLPKETVNYRIKRLSKKGYIKSFQTIINATKIGFYYYRISFKLQKLTPGVEKKIVNYILNNKRCLNLRQVEGPYDITFFLMQKNPSELRTFLRNFSTYFGKHLLEKSILIAVNTHKMNQKLTYSEKIANKVLKHSRADEIALDETDKTIVTELSRNSRIRLIDLARKIGKNYQIAGYRIKKLEKEEIIGSYNIQMDLQRFGKQSVMIDIVLNNPDKIASIIEYFDSTRKCLFAHETIGKYDLSVELHVESDTELRTIIEGFRIKFLEEYIQYDISKIFEEFVTNWSPFES